MYFKKTDVYNIEYILTSKKVFFIKNIFQVSYSHAHHFDNNYDDDLKPLFFKLPKIKRDIESFGKVKYMPFML